MPRDHSHRVEGFPHRRFGRRVFPTTRRQTFHLVICRRPLIPIHHALRMPGRRLHFEELENKWSNK
jgi:hypothetical protein